MKLTNIIAILAATTLTSLAFADGGEGRNGPDKTGLSTPVRIDQTLTGIEFERIQLACLTEQDEYLLSQLFGSNVPSNQTQKSHFNSGPNKTISNTSVVVLNQTTRECTEYKMWKSNENLSLSFKGVTSANSSFYEDSLFYMLTRDTRNYCSADIMVTQDRLFAISKRFFTFENSDPSLVIQVKDSYKLGLASSFDFLGIPSPANMVVSYSKSAPKIMFGSVDRSTKKLKTLPIGLKFNDMQYAQCISDRLAR